MRRTQVSDVPAALGIGGDLAARDAEARADRRRPSGRARRPAIRPAGRDRRRGARRARALRLAGAAASAEQPRADPLASSPARPSFLRSPASTPPSIAATMRSRTTTRSRSASTPRACAATASTACPTNTSPSRLPQVAPEIAAGRVIVAHLGSGASMCALVRRPQRREHDGLHRARRPADGHAAGPARSRRRALSDRGRRR